ncbi:MAG: hypothetical protein AB7J35_11440 [Dehalococcoidia bacterium]
MFPFRISDFGLWIAAVAVGLAAAGCSSGSKADPVPNIGSVEATRDVVDGKALLSSTLKVTLDREWKVVETELPFASLFELRVPLADGSSKRVLIDTAEKSSTNSRLVTLTVKSLVAQGSTLTIQRKAFVRDASGVISGEVDSALNPALVLLASEALAVSDPSFFDPGEVAPVSADDEDPAIQRAALEAHLKLRPGDPGTFVDKALAVYDSIPTDLVPSPKLRAALAGLSGTFADPAVASFMTANNCTNKPVARIAFEPPPDAPELLARMTHENGARVISINPFAEGERFEYLMPILAHEAIHCDDEAGNIEEIAATAFDSFLYLQLVAIEPDLAKGHTKVARELNVDAVAMINSGQRYPESVGVLPSVGVTAVLPYTNSTAGSFAELVANAYSEVPSGGSPAESVALAYANIIATATGDEVNDPFNLTYLDALLGRAVDGGVFANALDAFGLVPQ